MTIITRERASQSHRAEPTENGLLVLGGRERERGQPFECAHAKDEMRLRVESDSKEDTLSGPAHGHSALVTLLMS